MIVKGFKFGMMLQFVIGPVCIFVFNLASNNGFIDGIFAVAGVTAVDALYIFLASVGISRFLNLKKHEKLFSIIGASIILLFSVDIILGTACGISILPKLSLSIGNMNALGGFWQAVVLTASSPVTILFWSGVFSVKIIENKLGRADVILFSIGAVLSTLVFLGLIVCLGVIFHRFLPEVIMKLVNIIIAIILIYFSLTKLLKRRSSFASNDQ